MTDPPLDDFGQVPRRLQTATRTNWLVLARSAVTITSRIVSKFAIVVFLVVAARVLSTEQFGVYSYVLVLAQTFGILSDPQLALVAGRDVSTGRRDVGDAFWSVLPVVVVAGLMAALAMIAFGMLAPADGATLGVLALGGAFVVCNRLMELGSTMLRSTGRFELEAAVQTTGTVGLVVVAMLLADAGHSVSLVLVAFSGQALLSATVCVWVLRKELGRPRRGAGSWRPMVATGVRLSVAASAAAVATRAPLVVLGVTGAATQVAALSAALRVSDAAYLLALTAGQALLPGLSSLATQDRARARALTIRVVAVGATVGVVAAIALAANGSAIMGAVFGSRYKDAGDLFAASMVAVPFSALFWISWFGLFAFGRERAVVRATVGGAIVGVLGAIVAIPLGGPTAAAWTYSGAIAFLGCATFAAFLRREPPTAPHPTGRPA